VCVCVPLLPERERENERETALVCVCVCVCAPPFAREREGVRESERVRVYVSLRVSQRQVGTFNSHLSGGNHAKDVSRAQGEHVASQFPALPVLCVCVCVSNQAFLKTRQSHMMHCFSFSFWIQVGSLGQPC